MLIGKEYRVGDNSHKIPTTNADTYRSRNGFVYVKFDDFTFNPKYVVYYRYLPSAAASPLDHRVQNIPQLVRQTRASYSLSNNAGSALDYRVQNVPQFRLTRTATIMNESRNSINQARYSPPSRYDTSGYSSTLNYRDYQHVRPQNSESSCTIL